MTEYKKWIIIRDVYDSNPYECPYCAARIGIQKTICPNCNKPVIVNDFKKEDFDYEEYIETLIKLP